MGPMGPLLYRIFLTATAENSIQGDSGDSVDRAQQGGMSAVCRAQSVNSEV